MPKKINARAVEIAHWLIIFAALAEDTGLVHSSHILANNQLSVTPIAEDLISSSGLCIHVAQGIHQAKYPYKYNYSLSLSKDKI